MVLTSAGDSYVKSLLTQDFYLSNVMEMESQLKENLIPRKGNPKNLSIVIPCYNEQEVLPKLHSGLLDTLDKLAIEFEVILVDDGSKDATWRLLSELNKNDSRFKALRLSRNYGHQIALTCGLDQAQGEVVVIMDADLQDPPEVIPQMLEKWREGYDVVYGKRMRRDGDSPSKRFFAFSFYRIMNLLTGMTIPRDTGDFRLMDKAALNAFRELRERQRFIRGMVSWIGFNQAPVYYDRPKRAAGVTKYPFKKSFLLALDAITSFSYAPLRLASLLGFLLSLFAFLYIIVVILLKFAGINFPGYTSLMATILLLGGVQLVVLGVIGEYLGRIYEEVKGRPLYYISSSLGVVKKTTRKKTKKTEK